MQVSLQRRHEAAVDPHLDLALPIFRDKDDIITPDRSAWSVDCRALHVSRLWDWNHGRKFVGYKRLVCFAFVSVAAVPILEHVKVHVVSNSFVG